MQPTAGYSVHTYEIRPRKDGRGVDLISDALPSGRLWYLEVRQAIDYAKHQSRSHDAVIRVYDVAGKLIEVHRQGILRRFKSRTDAGTAVQQTIKLGDAANCSLKTDTVNKEIVETILTDFPWSAVPSQVPSNDLASDGYSCCVLFVAVLHH